MTSIGRRRSRIITHPTGRDFTHLVIPWNNPSIAIPTYDRFSAFAIASRITRGVDVPEDYLHIPVTDTLRRKHQLPEEVPPPDQIPGWHPFKRVSHAQYVRDLSNGLMATRTEHDADGRPVYFSARLTYLYRHVKQAHRHTA